MTVRINIGGVIIFFAMQSPRVSRICLGYVLVWLEVIKMGLFGLLGVIVKAESWGNL
ncbi:MAG TPA: hypothetical protein H9853_09790 [Candidatus Sphingobacterium stercoripullorum]|uniref:Uncharacterized protein n=1 Tax=Candidatus Sphingobacterium stercoripullorum TaxID=2838759 RepID=A0A9D1WA75_9SPHI|nr:hypothetical protein [Candidatus Sphingobacterium stercoripullorum]